VDDRRACTDCACGQPVGSMCVSSFSIGKDLTCMDSAVGNIDVGSEPTHCTDLSPPGLPLGSKAATPPTYFPGVCPSIGGEPVAGGAAEATEATTFCCLRLSVPK